MIEIILGLSLAQWIGFLAAIVCIFATFQKNDKALLFIAAVGIGIWAIHYGMLGGYTGMIANILVSVRCLITLKWQGPWVGVPFAGIFVIIGYFAYQSPASLLPISSSIVGSLGTTMLSGVKMRIALIICSGAWFTYAFIYGSLGGMFLETLNVLLYGYTIYRIKKENTTHYL